MDNKELYVIEEPCPLYDCLVYFGASFPNIKNRVMSYHNSESIFTLPYGSSEIEYDGYKFTLNSTRSENSVGTYNYAKMLKEIILSTDAPKEIVSKFFKEATAFYYPKESKDTVRSYIYDAMSSGWKEVSELSKRDLGTIYLAEGILETTIDDITEFLASRDDYKKFNIPYKRNYLLEGIPGTGKTSLIFSLASKFGYDVACINFGPSMTDTKFATALAKLRHYPKSFLVLEDIDSLFIKRDTNKENKSNISFSGILNTLDGMARQDSQIIFMTTNYKDRLDPALIRPGRIDYHLRFDHATEFQIRTMFKKFLPHQERYLEKFIDKTRHLKVTTACLQKLFFYNRKGDNILKHVDDLKKILKESEAKEDKSNIGDMYT
jgi:chaperone BCS1